MDEFTNDLQYKKTLTLNNFLFHAVEVYLEIEDIVQEEAHCKMEMVLEPENSVKFCSLE